MLIYQTSILPDVLAIHTLDEIPKSMIYEMYVHH